MSEDRKPDVYALGASGRRHRKTSGEKAAGMRMRAKYVSVQIASARGVAERWARQYQHPTDGWRDLPNHKAKEIYDQLIALGPNPPIDKAAEIIGNKSWSYITCDGCNEHVERAAAIGEYEPKTYCTTCIAEAASALAVPALLPQPKCPK